nr:zinc-binding alcohol dehydrogenase family protein [Propionicimonas sp.]
MKAAVVTDVTSAPRCADFPEPSPRDGFVQVQMLAAGVHQVVRSIAAGAHYSSGDELPFVAGVDGVGLIEGRRVYTGGCPDPLGTIAERTLVPAGFAVPVPDVLPTDLAAAVVNPAMSSWLPLVSRGLRPGGTVLVLGATGTAGQLAVQVALHLGAGRVLAAGRNAAVLARLAADPRVSAVSLSGPREEAVAAIAASGGPDIVLDYLWGPVAELALDGLRSRSLVDGGSAVQYVQIGALAGRTAALDAAILRARDITISGSGAGSIDRALLFTELPKLLDAAASGELTVEVRVAPLADVAEAWTSAAPGRLVISMV